MTAALAFALALIALSVPLPFTASWPTGLVPANESCGTCHERGSFGVATTVTQVNGIDPEWGSNRGGDVTISPGGVFEVEWRTTGLGYDYGEVAGFVLVPNTTQWQLSPHTVRDNAKEWEVPWMIASSDEKGKAHDNRRTWVTAYEHVHRAGDPGFPGGRGYGSDKDDGSALDLNGVAHDEYLGARVHAPTTAGNFTLVVGAAGMPQTLVYKGSWIEIRLRVAPVTAPRVTSVVPADGAAGVSVLDLLVLTFDRPMDRASTEGAFALVPPANGSLQWNVERTSLSFTPESILEFSTSYAMKIAAGARDRSGITMGVDYATGFTTQPRPPFTVFLSSPRGGERLAGGAATVIQGAVLGGIPPYDVTFLLSTDSGVTYPTEIARQTMAQAGSLLRNWSAPLLDSETVRVAASVRDSSPTEVVGESRDLAIDSSAPRVLTVFPSAGEVNVSRFSPIVVSFSEPMDMTGTESAFVIEPPAPGGFMWDGANLTLQPGELLYGSATYRVSMGTAAADLVGNRLLAPMEIEFSTEKDWSVPRVASRSPAGDGASAYANIVIKFNKLMLRNATEAAFAVVPSVAGGIRWDLATMTFEPSDGFRYSTKYNVTISKNAEDLVGFHPDADESWEFIVIPSTPPALIARSPLGEDVAIDTKLEATFSDHMDQPETVAAFAIAPETRLAAAWNGKRSLSLAPEGPLSGLTTYTVSLSTLARNTRGVALSASVEWNFTTGAGRDLIPPSVMHVQPDSVGDIERLNITIAVEDNVGARSVLLRYRTSPGSGFAERPMDLYAGSVRDGAFRSVFEAPFRPQVLEYEIVVADADNLVLLPGGGTYFSVAFTASRDTTFPTLVLLAFILLAPLAAYAALYASGRTDRGTRTTGKRSRTRAASRARRGV